MCDLMAFAWACAGVIGLFRGSDDFWKILACFVVSSLYAVAGGLRRDDTRGREK